MKIRLKLTISWFEFVSVLYLYLHLPAQINKLRDFSIRLYFHFYHEMSILLQPLTALQKLDSFERRFSFYLLEPRHFM